MAERAAGLQSTQRNWSNYIGYSPIDRFIGTSFYEDSPIYGPSISQAPIDRVANIYDNKISRETNLPKPPEGYVYNRFGYLEPKEWYNKEGKKMTESEYRKSKEKKSGRETQPTLTMPPQDESFRFSLFGGSPMLNWPYSNY